jgi:nitrate/TMAO reductase-like tetraheme cytochrome c subunit
MTVSRFLAAVAVLGLVGVAAPAQAGAQATKPSVSKHAAEGREDCLSCHATATDSTKAVPAETHANRPNESCLLCHAKDAAIQTKDAPAFKHSPQGKTNCQMCHKEGKMKAPVTPAAAHPAAAMDNKTCAFCHKHVP